MTNSITQRVSTRFIASALFAIVAFLFISTATAQAAVTSVDAYYTVGTGYTAISVDFSTEEISTATGVELRVNRAGGETYSITAKPTVIGIINAPTATVTGPIVITGSRTSTSWNGQTGTWSGSALPESVDVIITLSDGEPITLRDDTISENRASWSEVQPVVVEEPTQSPSTGGGGNGRKINLNEVEEESEETEEDDEVETPEGEVLGEATTTPAVVYYSFLSDFGIGSTGTDVTNLQTILMAAGFLNIDAPTGYFGQLTFAAVQKYQSAHAISNTGFVGPLTRAQLNTTPVTSVAQQIVAILAQIAVLQAQLDALKAE